MVSVSSNGPFFRRHPREAYLLGVSAWVGLAVACAVIVGVIKHSFGWALVGLICAWTVSVIFWLVLVVILRRQRAQRQ